jgi:predicted adenine nucleotide alpha hydrolase (AANH) superfamily ATPase
MKLLLHVCCAPCFIYPLNTLREKGFEVTGLFYNPNIFPISEYALRKQALENFNNLSKTTIIYPDYNPLEYAEAVRGEEDSSGRCSLCWELRIKKTAQVAKEKGFNYFTTTLLVSPYQDQEALKKIGFRISREAGIDFYYQDFRPGYKQAHEEARAKGLYCQKYCGCRYSESIRFKKHK